MIHGTKKQTKIKTQQQVKEEEQLSQKINNKLGQFFAIPRNNINTQKIPVYFQFTSLLMQLTSDIPTIFNFRRQLIMREIENKTDTQRQKIFGGQIKLTTKLIQSDPKSYTIWSYRQWLVKSLFVIYPAIIEAEKQLIKMLLMKDEKNFHVWNYRNWLNSIQAFIDQDLIFTQEKIKSNPFNFSPYHFRTKFLQQKYQTLLSECQQTTKNQIITFGMPKSVLQIQFERVKTAIFLNPNQQAPWTFYNWLLNQLIPAFIVCKELIDNKWIIYLNMKSNSFQNLIERESKTLINLSGKSNSQVWHLELPEVNQLNISSTLQKYENLKLQSNSKLFLAEKISAQWIKSNIKSIFDRQIKFINEVIQSQEDICRFAYLQRSYICRFILQCGTNSQEFSQIIALGHESMQKIKDQSKAQKFIQKQLLYWTKMKQGQLSKIENSLKNLFD